MKMFEEENSEENKFPPFFFREQHSVSGSTEHNIRNLWILSDHLKDVRFEDLYDFDKIGTGAFGRVYKCRIQDVDQGHDEDFAVKIYKGQLEGKEKTRMFEKDSLVFPIHENLITILKFSSSETIDITKLPDRNSSFWRKTKKTKKRNSVMIIMKYYPYDLSKFLKLRQQKNKFPLSIKEASLIFRGILEGVKILNSKPIIHRDLHPGNFFLNPPKGEVVIGDYGLTLDLRNNRGGCYVRKTDEKVFYTRDTLASSKYLQRGGGEDSDFGFMAPEIKNFDPENEEYINYEKSDLYSVGIIGGKLLESVVPKSGVIFERLKNLVSRLVETELEKRIGHNEACGEIKSILDFVGKHKDPKTTNYMYSLKSFITPQMLKKSDQINYCFENDIFRFRFDISIQSGRTDDIINLEGLRILLNGEAFSRFKITNNSIEFEITFTKIERNELICIYENINNSFLIDVEPTSLGDYELLFYRAGDSREPPTEEFSFSDSIQINLKLVNKNGVPLLPKFLREELLDVRIIMRHNSGSKYYKQKGILSREYDIEIDQIDEKGEFWVCSIEKERLREGKIYEVRVDGNDINVKKIFSVL